MELSRIFTGLVCVGMAVYTGIGALSNIVDPALNEEALWAGFCSFFTASSFLLLNIKIYDAAEEGAEELKTKIKNLKHSKNINEPRSEKKIKMGFDLRPRQ